MSDEKTFAFAGEAERLDRFLTRSLASLSRTRVQRLIDEGAVTVNGRREPARRLLETGDHVRVQIPTFSALPPAAAGECSDPLRRRRSDCGGQTRRTRGSSGRPPPNGYPDRTPRPKLSAGWAETGQRPTTDRPGVVHRLDKGTSGVMLIAKTPAAAENLASSLTGPSKKPIGLLCKGRCDIPRRIRSRRAGPATPLKNVHGDRPPIGNRIQRPKKLSGIPPRPRHSSSSPQNWQNPSNPGPGGPRPPASGRHPLRWPPRPPPASSCPQTRVPTSPNREILFFKSLTTPESLLPFVPYPK